MKKLLQAAIVITALTASSAFAAPLVGTYDSPEVLEGRWSESYVGTEPTQVGNEIKAASWDGATLGGQWELAGPTVQSDTPTGDSTTNDIRVQQFYTVYDVTDSDLTLKDGPWTAGGDGDYTVSLTSFTQSTIITSFQGNVLTVSGAISMTGTFDGNPGFTLNYLAATTRIVGEGASAPADYPSLSTAQGQWGDAFDVQLQIIPEPATLAVLSLGGLVALTRRRNR